MLGLDRKNVLTLCWVVGLVLTMVMVPEVAFAQDDAAGGSTITIMLSSTSTAIPSTISQAVLRISS